MVKFELTMESGQKLQFIAKEYDLHLAGIDKQTENDIDEMDIYTWLTYAKVFGAQNKDKKFVLGVASKVETIRKIEPKEWF